MVGFLATVVLLVGAFVWVSSCWATALMVCAAVAVAWYSVGLYAQAASAAAHRSRQGYATEEDIRLLGELGTRSRREAFRAAGYEQDDQQDDH